VRQWHPRLGTSTDEAIRPLCDGYFRVKPHGMEGYFWLEAERQFEQEQMRHELERPTIFN
jgi:hypothetical protein